MPARFHVDDTFRLESRGLFVVHGTILDGAAQRGQRVVAPPGIDVPVDAVEFVLLSVTERRENVAICFRHHSDEELARWQSLSLAGAILELADGLVDEDRAPAV